MRFKKLIFGFLKIGCCFAFFEIARTKPFIYLKFKLKLTHPKIASDFCYEAWANCEPDAGRVHSGMQNQWHMPKCSGVHILPCQKEKNH